MVFPKKPAPAIRDRGPDILLAIREGLIDSCLKGSGILRRNGEVVEPSNDAAPLQSLQAADDDSAITPPPDNSLDRHSRQSNLRTAGLNNEGPTIVPSELSLDVDLRHSTFPPDRNTDNPKIARVLHLTSGNLQQSSLHSDGLTSDKPSVGYRALRTVASGIVLVAMGVSAFVLLSYDNHGKRNIIGAWDHLSQRWLQTAPGTNPTPAATAVAVSKPSPQAPIQVTAVSAAAPSVQPPAALPIGSPSDSQSVEAVVKELGIVRHLVEGLVAKQDQLARDIAVLQAAEADVKEKIASLPQSSTAHVRPRKRILKKSPPNEQ